ncbi:acyl-CoA N-acyltransferase [Hypoxylon sp. NC0597]|nr:acyl-CoA N-acyltransferase [Hypoxylon sp. NC0597]
MNTTPQIPFSLSDVEVSDAASIAQKVDVPAMQNGPLYRMMFPLSDTMTEAQRSEVVRWYADMLEDAFQERWEKFLKASSPDGTPIGFCGWTVIERNPKQVEVGKSLTEKQPGKENQKKATWLPEVLDIDGWTSVSKALRVERERILKNIENICRLTFMAVDPKYQRQGIGSAMMQRVCEETDQHGRCAYVLAAPEGVRLYSKFGFGIVGHVETPQGTITSMFRQARK